MTFISRLFSGSKLKIALTGLGIMLLAMFAGYMVYEGSKAEVTVNADDETHELQTHASTVDEVLDEVDITVGKHDALSHEADAAVEDGMTIDYKAAKAITVNLDDDKQTYYTTADTIQAFLDKQNIAYSKKDDISKSLDETINDGETITIDQAFQVTINDGDKKQDIWTTGESTIKELLKKEDIELDKQDKVKPKLDKTVSEETPIDITRVKKKTKETKHDIPFDTETKKDSSLAKGKEKVISSGSEGQLVKTHEITLENGEKVDSEVVNKDVVKESSNKVVAVGTKEPRKDLTTLSDKKSKSSKSSKSSNSQSKSQDTSSSAPKSSSQTMTMTASSYSANCSGCSGVTRTGINLHANPNKKVVAVDPNVIPLGSRVWVEGYGEAIAGDTGGAIKGKRIDLHVPTRQQANSYGFQKVKVKILD